MTKTELSVLCSEIYTKFSKEVERYKKETVAEFLNEDYKAGTKNGIEMSEIYLANILLMLEANFIER